MNLTLVLFIGIFGKNLLLSSVNAEKCSCTYKAGIIMIDCNLDNKKIELQTCLHENEKFLDKIEAIILKCDGKTTKKDSLLNLKVKFVKAYSLYVMSCGETDIRIDGMNKTGILSSKTGNLVSIV